jgi:hypothetical protein
MARKPGGHKGCPYSKPAYGDLVASVSDPVRSVTRATQAAYFEGGCGKKNFVRRISAPISSLNPPTRVKS